MESPYKLHPLFLPRRILIFNATVGFFFAVPTLGYDDGIWFLHMLLLLISGLVSFYDFHKWLVQKIEKPDEDPKWPRKWVMIMDALLVPALIYSFLAEFLDGSSRHYYYDAVLVKMQAYLSLTTLLASVLHGYCLWKEVMTVKHRQWLAELPRHVNICARHRPVTSTDTTFDSAPQENVNPQPRKTTLGSRLFSFGSRKPHPGLDASTDSITQPGCLITPVTDDEEAAEPIQPRPNRAYGTMSNMKNWEEVAVAYEDDEETMTVKKKRKSGKSREGNTDSRKESKESLPPVPVPDHVYA